MQIESLRLTQVEILEAVRGSPPPVEAPMFQWMQVADAQLAKVLRGMVNWLKRHQHDSLHLRDLASDLEQDLDAAGIKWRVNITGPRIKPP